MMTKAWIKKELPFSKVSERFHTVSFRTVVVLSHIFITTYHHSASFFEQLVSI